MSYILYTAGSCRGDSFRYKHAMSKDQVKKFIEEIDHQTSIEDVYDRMPKGMPDDFYHLFENVSYKQDIKLFKKRFINLMKKVDKGTIVTANWEEGATGIAIKRKEKELITKVKLCDYESLEGEDISNFEIHFK